MMTIMKKIAALVTATAIAFTSFVEASASDYYLTGNAYIAEAKASYGEGLAYNFCDLIEQSPLNPFEISVWSYVSSDGDVFSITETALNDMIDVPLSAYAKAANASTFYTTIKMAEFCVYACADFSTALLELSEAKRAEHNAMVNTYFNCPANGCITITKAIWKRVNAGGEISDDILSQVQGYIDSLHNDVAYLRNMASKRKYKKYKSELKEMADCLENLINTTNVKAIYAEAWNAKHYAFFEKSTTSSAGACVSMILKSKGTPTSQSEIARIGGSNFSFGAVERTLGLDDNNSYVVLDGHFKQEQVRRITQSLSRTCTAGILRLSPIPEDNFRSYILVTGVSNGELLVVDPFYNGKIETATEYAARNGYSVTKFYSRLFCFWAYI